MFSVDDLDSLLEEGGAWIDWYKFSVGAHIFQPPSLVQDKVQLLQKDQTDALQGGKVLEDAIGADQMRSCLEA